MADLNTSITPAPKVSCLTKGGDVSTSFTGNVTVALAANPTGATLSGTKTVAAVSGVATFSDLKLNRSGSGFTLRATATNLRATTSAAFSIPTELTFTTQPPGGDEDEIFAAVVKALDSDGNTDTNYTGNVTVSIYTADAPGVLSGTLTVAAVSGVATFSDLSIDEDGGYTLLAVGTESANCFTPASIVSNPFIIGLSDYTVTLEAQSPGFRNCYRDISQPIGGTAWGSISSPNTYNGQVISGVDCVNTPQFELRINGSGLTQAFFTQVVFNGVTFVSASATSYVDSGGLCRWLWQPGAVFEPVGPYTMTIT